MEDRKLTQEEVQASLNRITEKMRSELLASKNFSLPLQDEEVVPESIHCEQCGGAWEPLWNERFGSWEFDEEVGADGVCMSCRVRDELQQFSQAMDKLAIDLCKQISHADRQAYERFTLGEFEVDSGNKDAHEAVLSLQKMLLGNEPLTTGIILHGGKGVGKTHLAMGLVRSAWDHNIPALLLNEPELMEMVKESYRTPVPDLDYISRKLGTMPLVVIDDVGMGYMNLRGARRGETSNEWYKREVMYPLLNTRYINQGMTIITTNLTPEALFKHLGEANASRVKQLCAASYEMKGKDRRAQGWTK